MQDFTGLILFFICGLLAPTCHSKPTEPLDGDTLRRVLSSVLEQLVQYKEQLQEVIDAQVQHSTTQIVELTDSPAVEKNPEFGEGTEMNARELDSLMRNMSADRSVKVLDEGVTFPESGLEDKKEIEEDEPNPTPLNASELPIKVTGDPTTELIDEVTVTNSMPDITYFTMEQENNGSTFTKQSEVTLPSTTTQILIDKKEPEISTAQAELVESPLPSPTSVPKQELTNSPPDDESEKKVKAASIETRDLAEKQKEFLSVLSVMQVRETTLKNVMLPKLHLQIQRMVEQANKGITTCNIQEDVAHFYSLLSEIQAHLHFLNSDLGNLFSVM